MNMKKKFFFALFLCLLSALIVAKSIKDSKHNLSSGGALGAIKSTETSMLCIFCHTTHVGNSFAPMWNRKEGAPVYTLYNSSTLQSIPGQPDGASKLCLSCHDGTIALGRLFNRKDNAAGLEVKLGRIPPGRSSNLGSDLSDDHPISFDPSAAVNASPELVHPAPFDHVKYDAEGKIQCTTCHNAHDDAFTKFLVKSNQNGAICKSCHELSGYNGISSHDIATGAWNGQNENPWPHTDFTTVAGNSCLNCHRSHGAGGKERLLNASEENGCLVCHNGNVGKNISTELSKISSHKVNFYQGIHDPTENILAAPVHSECVDCHNPHRINSAAANAPNVSGNLTGVSGMSITGALKDTAQYEYEICLKCHGQDQYRVTTTLIRLFDTGNMRVAINTTNASFHPMAARGKRSWVPSLTPPYTTSSRIYCWDCHNSDSSAAAGGSGPNGPHGSRYENLLERRYEMTDYTHWSVSSYALCFKCHNPNSLLDENVSGFKEHRKHIDEENTPCSVCHDPHGSPNYVGLLNFDTNVVFPNMSGELKFEILGNRGYCYMQCHGKDHSPKEYERK